MSLQHTCAVAQLAKLKLDVLSLHPRGLVHGPQTTLRRLSTHLGLE